MEVVVGGEPGQLLAPGDLHPAFEVRHRRDLVLVGLLPQAVERVAGVQLRALGEVLEVADRHELPLGHAVDVDVGAQAVAHARLDELGLERGELR
jgi:hypothetical protein